MTSTDHGPLLHNMSAPPKSVVKYTGLAELGPMLEGDTDPSGTAGRGVFGTPVRFDLPIALEGKLPGEILDSLGIAAEPDPDSHLVRLINARAAELPLPDGCLVIPAGPTHPRLWSDALTALAILSKCSDTLWLRAKAPALLAARQRNSVSLLVPPNFAHQLPKAAL